MRRKTLIPLAVVAIVLALAACSHETQQAFTYHGVAVPGSTIRIRNLNGPVEIVPSTNGQLEIVAEPHTTGGGLMAPQKIRFVTTPDAHGITVCALSGDDGRCDAEHYTTHSNTLMGLIAWHRPVIVIFKVSLPPELKLDASTVNGPVSAHGLHDAVTLATVNGPVEVEASGGPVSVKTVNGPITAHLSALADSGDLSFRTVNGPVELFLPAQIAADFDGTTVNGSISSDMSFASMTQMSKHHVSAKLGAGGRHLAASTVNGSVSLHSE